MSERLNLENLLDNLSTAVLLLDEKLDIQYANHAAQSVFDRGFNLLVGCSVYQYIVHSSLDLDRFSTSSQHGEAFSDSEVQISFADGRHILADVSATHMLDGKSKQILLEIRLIQQQKKISQETHQWAQQQAARELVRGLAHEIKNPLGGIRGAAQLLEKQLVSADQKEFTTVIIEQSDRLTNLVDRLLGPNARPNFCWQNIHQVIEKICTLVSLDLNHDIKIVRDYDPSIPDINIDQDMIQQAALNIVRNSVQVLTENATPNAQIKIITRIERHVIIHGVTFPLCAKIQLIDNGPGIPTELKDTLFYPMVTSKKQGTGLGLSISQTLIGHHRGKIEVDSWPGNTEFTLYLPIDKKDADK
ncbi:nitrogen regulation protein NR(II) [Paraglaciecola hydrolytica]|uniref:Sensory histidine kinase/phosphatase NtrB n=1 Tax=Paraglaciecola hydrolytica TaxID=1799789 RepID=A0A148KMR2_9ALTE|nr:nitrogen regulation protein NR(II) [Paraglaciecola hydrolytica]KXI27535.1 PAS domain-containing sensor histidine kinase [Paraglaciecola hydrolytica]